MGEKLRLENTASRGARIQTRDAGATPSRYQSVSGLTPQAVLGSQKPDPSCLQPRPEPRTDSPAGQPGPNLSLALQKASRDPVCLCLALSPPLSLCHSVSLYIFHLSRFLSYVSLFLSYVSLISLSHSLVSVSFCLLCVALSLFSLNLPTLWPSHGLGLVAFSSHTLFGL